MVSDRLALRMAVRRRLQSLSRDILRSAAAVADRIYMRTHFSNMFEMPTQKLCIDLKVNREYMCGTPDLGQKPSCSRKEDREGSETLSRDFSPFLLTFLVVLAILDG